MVLHMRSQTLLAWVQGALFMLAGTSTAATAAFFLSRTVGKTLAQRIVQEEMKESGAESQNAVASAFQKVEDAIEAGSFLQQVTAVTLLRLTPVIPFRCDTCLNFPCVVGPRVLEGERHMLNQRSAISVFQSGVEELVT